MKLVWRTDVHLADHAPQSRTDNWAETLLGKIQQVGEIARQEGAVTVLDGGDFFHKKSPFRNSHRLVNQVVEAHARYPCPVFACIGNHDVKYGDYSYLGEQPLGVLFESGVFKRLYDEHEVYFTTQRAFPFCRARAGWEDHNPFALPRREAPIVRVVGVPYHGTKYDMDRLTSIKKGEEDYLVVVAHLLASSAGGTMFEAEDIVKYSDLAGLDPDLWCIGHWHKDQGVTEISTGKQVVNIGSLSRGALSQDDLNRVPSVAVLSFSPLAGIQVEVRPLDVRPASEVFDIEGRVRAEARQFSVEAFVDSIRETLEETQQDEVDDIIRGLPDVPESVKEQAILFWEQSRK